MYMVQLLPIQRIVTEMNFIKIKYAVNTATKNVSDAINKFKESDK